MSEIYNLQQIVTIRGIKASIISLTATLEEVVWAYSTDTNELGIYTNGNWVWIGGGGDSEVLMQDGVIAPPVPIENEDQDDWLYSV